MNRILRPEKQREVFEIHDTEQGLSLKQSALRLGWEESTIRQLFRKEAVLVTFPSVWDETKDVQRWMKVVERDVYTTEDGWKRGRIECLFYALHSEDVEHTEPCDISIQRSEGSEEGDGPYQVTVALQQCLEGLCKQYGGSLHHRKADVQGEYHNGEWKNFYFLPGEDSEEEEEVQVSERALKAAETVERVIKGFSIDRLRLWTSRTEGLVLLETEYWTSIRTTMTLPEQRGSL